MNFEYRDAIIKGDSQTLKKMIAEFRPKFDRVLKKYGANTLECKEYFQISLKNMVENIVLDNEKEIPNSKFFNYFLTIGLNKWRTYCKQKGREMPTKDLPEMPSEASILEDMMRKEKHTFFMQKFRKLGLNCQKLLWKKIVEEINYKDIAREMDKSEKYLRVQLNRCKKYLIKLLASDNNFYVK